jgi:hypothetical protein
MARLGEGDPRWLVTDRQDGRNVNAWHWYILIYFSYYQCAVIDCFSRPEFIPVLQIFLRLTS